MRVLCIDPGLRGCGVALGYTTTGLERAWYEKGLGVDRLPDPREAAVWMAKTGLDRGQSLTVIEFPRIYPHAAQRRGDLNDIVMLGGVAVGLAAASTSPVEFVYPADWKGQVPKDVMNRRVDSLLKPDERTRIISVGAKDHNTLDAVGIFLWKAGRLKGAAR